jgi:ribosomal protein S18 acetylase RimI-like enzyme
MIIYGSGLNSYRQIAESTAAEMQLLAVDPALRGRGLGRDLVNAANADLVLVCDSQMNNASFVHDLLLALVAVKVRSS